MNDLPKADARDDGSVDQRIERHRTSQPASQPPAALHLSLDQRPALALRFCFDCTCHRHVESHYSEVQNWSRLLSVEKSLPIASDRRQQEHSHPENRGRRYVRDRAQHSSHLARSPLSPLALRHSTAEHSSPLAAAVCLCPAASLLAVPLLLLAPHRVSLRQRR